MVRHLLLPLSVSLSLVLVVSTRADPPPCRATDRASLARRLVSAERMLDTLDAAPWQRTDIIVVERVFESDQTYYGERLWNLDHYASLDPIGERLLLYTGVLQPSLARPWTLRRRPDLVPVATEDGIDIVTSTPLGPLRVGIVLESGEVEPIAAAKPALGRWIYDPFLDAVHECIPSASVLLDPLDPRAGRVVEPGALTALAGVSAPIPIRIDVAPVGDRLVPVLAGGVALCDVGRIGPREEATLQAMRALPGHLISVDRIAFPQRLVTLDPRVATIEGDALRMARAR